MPAHSHAPSARTERTSSLTSMPASRRARAAGLLAGAYALLLVAAPSAPAAVLGPPTTFPAGSDTWSIAAGRLNGDRYTDLAVTNGLTDEVKVLLGDGEGGFGPATGYTTGHNGRPRGVAIGDFDRDGRRDIVVANFHTSTIGMLLGAAAGTFSPLMLSGAAQPRQLATGDLDGDGKLDLASTYPGDNFSPGHAVGVLLGRGDGSFAGAGGVLTGGRPMGLAIGDLDGDGTPDIVTVDQRDADEQDDGGVKGVSVLLGTGDGHFRLGSHYDTLDSLSSVAIGDLNGDARPDLAIAGYGGGVVVMLNVGHGSFGAMTSIAAPGGFSIALRDMDGDGIRDIVTDGVAVLRGVGDGSFLPAVGYGGRGQSLAMGDYNADGRPDVATVAMPDGKPPRVNVLLNTAPALITGVAPAAGRVRGGTLVTITGGHFAGAGQVRFGRTPALRFRVLDDRTVRAVAPPGAPGVANIRVIAPAGISPKGPADHFTYLAAGVSGRPGP